jgi:hypothetical protein
MVTGRKMVTGRSGGREKWKRLGGEGGWEEREAGRRGRLGGRK